MKTDRGSTTGELVLLVPVVMMLILFAVYVGRVTQTSTSLQHVADIAAREASLASRKNTQRRALVSAQRELLNSGVNCHHVKIYSAVRRLDGLTAISVDIECRVSLNDLALMKPFPLSLHASSISVIDRYRAE